MNIKSKRHKKTGSSVPLLELRWRALTGGLEDWDWGGGCSERTGHSLVYLGRAMLFQPHKIVGMLKGVLPGVQHSELWA